MKDGRQERRNTRVEDTGRNTCSISPCASHPVEACLLQKPTQKLVSTGILPVSENSSEKFFQHAVVCERGKIGKKYFLLRGSILLYVVLVHKIRLCLNPRDSKNLKLRFSLYLHSFNQRDKPIKTYEMDMRTFYNFCTIFQHFGFDAQTPIL